MYVRVYVCVYVCTCVYVHMCECVYVSTCLCMRVCMYVRVYVHVCMSLHVCVCCIHVCVGRCGGVFGKPHCLLLCKKLQMVRVVSRSISHV